MDLLEEEVFNRVLAEKVEKERLEKETNPVIDPKKKHVSKLVPGIDPRIKQDPVELEKEYARLRKSYLDYRAERSVHEEKYGAIPIFNFYDEYCSQ